MKIEVEEIGQYIGVILDIMSLSIAPQFLLQPPERRFLIEVVKLHWEGVDIASKRSVNRLNERFDWKPGSRHVYKNRMYLKNKGWLIKHEDGYSLPPLLSKPLPDKVNFNVEVSYVRHSSEDNTGGGEVF